MFSSQSHVSQLIYTGVNCTWQTVARSCSKMLHSFTLLFIITLLQMFALRTNDLCPGGVRLRHQRQPQPLRPWSHGQSGPAPRRPGHGSVGTYCSCGGYHIFLWWTPILNIKRLSRVLPSDPPSPVPSPPPPPPEPIGLTAAIREQVRRWRKIFRGG